jgi:hypothetical protein
MDLRFQVLDQVRMESCAAPEAVVFGYQDDISVRMTPELFDYPDPYRFVPPPRWFQAWFP